MGTSVASAWSREDWANVACLVRHTDDFHSIKPRMPDLIFKAIGANEVEALAALLSVPQKSGLLFRQGSALGTTGFFETKIYDWLEHTLTNDAAECALYLLNCCEQRRERLAEEAKQTPGEAALPAPALTRLAKRERHSIPDVDTAIALENFARHALGRSPSRRRCARAFLLHAHRLLKTRPENDKPLVDENGAGFERVAGFSPVTWPSVMCDMPEAAARALASGDTGEAADAQAENGEPAARKRRRPIGGWDMSEGAEPLPVQWINEVDGELPPAFLFLRRAVDVDVHPDWAKKLAKGAPRSRRDRVPRCAAGMRHRGDTPLCRPQDASKAPRARRSRAACRCNSPASPTVCRTWSAIKRVAARQTARGATCSAARARDCRRAAPPPRVLPSLRRCTLRHPPSAARYSL